MERQSTRRLFRLAVALVSLFFLCMGLFALTACDNGDTDIPVDPPHTHSFTTVLSEVEPTCTQQGSKVLACSCGMTQTTYTKALDHNFPNNWTVVTPATCEIAGSESRKCSRCQETQTQAIKPTGHKLTTDNKEFDIAATCEATGLDVEVCQNEGCTYRQQTVIAALGHDLKSDAAHLIKVYPSSCESEGWTVYGCLRCDYTKNDNYTAKLNHNYKIYTKDHPLYKQFGDTLPVFIERDCTHNAYGLYVCTYCGDWPDSAHYLTGPDYDALGHQFGKAQVVAATCEVGGHTEKVCDVCGYTEISDETEATGHNVNGLGTNYTMEALIKGVEELMQLDGATALTVCHLDKYLTYANYEGDGYAFFCTNDNCDYEVVNATVSGVSKARGAHWVPVKDHTLEAGTTTDVVAWNAVKDGPQYAYAEPTCEVAGYQFDECVVCGWVDFETENAEIAKLGHSWEDPNREVRHEFKLDAETLYTPCEVDPGFEDADSIRTYLLAKADIIFAEKIDAIESDELVEFIEALEVNLDEEGNLIVHVVDSAAICLTCGKLQAAGEHVKVISKYAKDPATGFATEEFEWENKPLADFNDELTCWYVIDCVNCGLEFSDNTHNPATESDLKNPEFAGYYRNCRHGIMCKECGKELGPKGDHVLVSLLGEDGKIDTNSAIYENWIALQDKMPDTLKKAAVEAVASCTVAGYSNAEICQYCLEALAEGEDIKIAPQNLVPTTGTTLDKWNGTANATYAFAKTAHSFELDTPDYVIKYYSDVKLDAEIKGKLDCLTIKYAAKYCTFCGTAKIGNATDITKATESNPMKSGATGANAAPAGFYPFVKGAHKLALIANFEESLYFVKPTCVDVATIPTICVVCGTQVQVKANQNDFAWAIEADASGLVNASKIAGYYFTSSTEVMNGEKGTGKFEHDVADVDILGKDGTDFTTLFLTLDAKNHKHPTFETGLLKCTLHCDGESTTGVKVSDDEPGYDVWATEGDVYTCRGDLDHTAITITYRWSQRDIWNLTKQGLTVEFEKWMAEGRTFTAEEYELLNEEAKSVVTGNEDGTYTLAPFVNVISKCDPEVVLGDFEEVGAQHTILTKAYVQLFSADGTVIFDGAFDEGQIMVYSESYLRTEHLINGTVDEDAKSYSEVKEFTYDAENLTYTVYEDDEFFWAFAPGAVQAVVGIGAKGMTEEEYKDIFGLNGSRMAEGYYQFAEGAVICEIDDEGTVLGTPQFAQQPAEGADIAETILDLNGGTLATYYADWIIYATQKVTIKNGTILLMNGYFSDDNAYGIYVGGQLTLDNVKLVSGMSGLFVFPGAEVNITNSEIVAASGVAIAMVGTEDGLGNTYAYIREGDNSIATSLASYETLMSEVSDAEDAVVNVVDSKIVSLGYVWAQTGEDLGDYYAMEYKFGYTTKFAAIVVEQGTLNVEGGEIIATAHAIVIAGGEVALNGTTLSIGQAAHTVEDFEGDDTFVLTDGKVDTAKVYLGAAATTSTTKTKTAPDGTLYTPAAKEDTAAIYVVVDEEAEEAATVALNDVTVADGVSVQVAIENNSAEEVPAITFKGGNVSSASFKAVKGTALVNSDVFPAAKA